MPTEAVPAARTLRAGMALAPGLAFLNHGSYGAVPRRVLAELARLRSELEANPVAFLDPMRGLAGRLAAVRARIAAEVGAAPDDLALIENATEGVNLVAANLELRPGDEILTSDHEYAACEKVFARKAAESGARIVVARLALPMTSEAAFTATLAGAMTPRTRVLFLSHVTSATALLFPLAPLLAVARSRGIFTLIDGAHGPGQVDLDLTGLAPDAYAGNGHKWWMAPRGSGFLYLAGRHQARFRPLVISHGWVEGSERGAFGASRFIDAVEMQGTRDPSAFLALPAALDWQTAQGWSGVRARARDLARRAGEDLARLTCQPLLAEPGFRAPQMVACPLPPGTDPVALKAALLAEGIEIPCFSWQDRPILRLSVAGYTTRAEVGRLFAALKRLL